MRLIDADALREEMEARHHNHRGDMANECLWDVAIEECQAVLDAAPTVSCEGCESYRPWTATGSPDDSCCGNETLFGHMEDGCNPPATAACGYFKRRQP